MADRGLQVVYASNGRYQLNEEALERILLQDDVRDKPVVVVSVTGAYRGGKSFILDFFLRFINASDTARKSGEWIGNFNAPLEGFNWSSGSRLKTIGIHLWSKPAILALPSGEKVAVLLMDTQGFLDSQSTMRDTTTIFALSSLISSVQIYNICQSIKKDDLQHLQLLMQYAQLVVNDVGKHFQDLTFLVRDWCNTSDYSYGFSEGKKYLDNFLQVNQEQPEELQQMRRHIRSGFDKIDCFLMTHPGLAAWKHDFKGRLSDLRPEFTQNLMELVPMLFAPNRLTVKRVNGCRVTCSDLAMYIRTYLDMFNSSELPTPATILQATTDAGLKLATKAARAHYTAVMAAAGVSDGARGSSSLTVTPAALHRLHADAVAAAQSHFRSMNILADRRRIDETLAQLTEEFNRRLHNFEAINESRLISAKDEAVHLYVMMVLNGIQESDLCMNSRHLDMLHNEGNEAAHNYFDQSRLVSQYSEDRERPLLIMELKERYQQFVATNELNNRSACNEALSLFINIVDGATRNLCMSETALKTLVDRAQETAVQHFMKKRTHMSDNTDDKHLDELNKNIAERYITLEQLNHNNKETCHDAVVSFYREQMNKLFGANMQCLRPIDFENEEDEIRKDAIKLFHEKRTLGESDDNNDIYRDKLNDKITTIFQEYRDRNERMNRDAVEAGLAEYYRHMNANSQVNQPDLASLLFPMGIARAIASSNTYSVHQEAKRNGIRVFTGRRRGGRVGAPDSHYDELNRRIDRAFRN